MEERELKEKIEKGYILSRVIIEMVGKPKEHVETAFKQLIDVMKNNKSIAVLSEHREGAKEHEGEMWSTFAELEILLENFPMLIGFCFDYMPSSVEILEPKEFKFKSNEIASVLNEIQAKLHNLGVTIKKLKNENIFLKQNSANLLLNNLTTLLVNRKRDIEQLSKLTGITSKELKPFIDKLLKDGKIKEEEGKYTFNKK